MEAEAEAEAVEAALKSTASTSLVQRQKKICEKIIQDLKSLKNIFLRGLVIFAKKI